MPVHLLQAMPMLVLGLIALAWIIVRWVMLRRVGSRAGAVAHRELWVGLAVRRAVVEQLGSGSASISRAVRHLVARDEEARARARGSRARDHAEGVRVRRCTLAPYAFEGITTWLQRLERCAGVVERAKGGR
jgi:hypothetical protein